MKDQRQSGSLALAAYRALDQAAQRGRPDPAPGRRYRPHTAQRRLAAGGDGRCACAVADGGWSRSGLLEGAAGRAPSPAELPAAERFAMERQRWWSSACGGKAPRKKRRSSPVPGEMLQLERPRPAHCRRRLFGGARLRDPQPGCKRGSAGGRSGAAGGRSGAAGGRSGAAGGRSGAAGGRSGAAGGSGLGMRYPNVKPAVTAPIAAFSPGPKGKSHVKTLPKIKENLEVTHGIPSCSQSAQVNVEGTVSLEQNEEDVEDGTVPLRDSSVINFESKESLKNTDVTSGTGTTLPTGVSAFLLECLSADSTEDGDAVATDTTESFPSPETLRDEESSERNNPGFEDFFKCKNSTLLDCSKAVAVDKILQLSSLSPISEPVVEDCGDQPIKRKRPKRNYSSSELSVSTTLAGKKICKITTARERTPRLKSGMRCSSPVGPERKPDSQTAEPKRLNCSRKELCNLLEDNASSSGQLESAPANISTKSVKGTAEVLPSQQTVDVVTLCSRKEICSIVRTSPGQRPSRRRRIPVRAKPFCLPEGVPEDVITSSKTWICCEHR
ncbi:meiosis-specific kinetochore protein [Cyrtonyx montezumae]|uniref:meiosis-specific kinetochore protein n=1 Tax=Cyrtonyx montezumae TaxID=9017 RepID=UPI0032DBDDFB